MALMAGGSRLLDQSILPPSPVLDDPASLIGITTTVPSEIVFAAGYRPIDLNNLFVGAELPLAMVQEAEQYGFPHSTCSWTKGLFAAARRFGIDTLIGVVQGDCSNTHALMESIQFEGGRAIPFNFPYDRSAEALGFELAQLARKLGTTLEAAEHVRTRLAPIREKLRRLDELTWREGKVTGLENHLWLVSSSDFCGDPDGFEARLDAFLAAAASRPARQAAHRIGYVGVPPICPDLYEFLAGLDAPVVFNETQRQFSMPGPAGSLTEQYLHYTYPYGVFARIEDIAAQAAARRLGGIVHYVQSFCFRQIEDHILRRSLPLRCMTLEFDRPGALDGQTRTRVEAFVETL